MRYSALWTSLLCLIALPAAAQIIDLGTFDGYPARAFGLTASNVVIGSAVDGVGDTGAFLYSNGTLQNLGTLGGNFATAYAINDSNLVVGVSQTAVGDNHAFAFENGTMTDLGTLGGLASAAYAVDGNGAVVGGAHDGNQDWHAFYQPAGQSLLDLGTLGGLTSEARGVRADGTTVGWSLDGLGERRAFLVQSGTMSDLLGGNAFGDSAAWAITGDRVVGQFTDQTGDIRAFLYNLTSNDFDDLDTLGGTETIALAIQGDAVVGTALNGLNERHAFFTTAGTFSDLNLLLNAGASGWTLTHAYAVQQVSATDYTIAGIGTFGGEEHAFFATYSSIVSVPETGTLSLLTLLIVPLGAKLHRRYRQGVSK